MKKLLILMVLLSSLMRFASNVYAVDEIDFEDLFANHQSVMLVIHPVTGEIYYANQAAADFYGYTLETLLDMNIAQINTLTPEEVAAERIMALKEERNFFIFKHRLSNGDIRTVYVYSYPVDINGETYLYSIIIDQTAFVNTQNRNKILIISGITFLVFSTIVTSFLALKIYKKKKEIEEINETLSESEQRFKMLHDASFGGLLIHDQGLILDCNQALSDITGYSTEELIRSNSLTLIAPDYHDIVIDKIKTGSQMPYEAFGIRKNGEIYPLKLEARNIPYHGKLVRVVEFRDTTEFKKQEELKQEIENQWSKLVEEMPLGFNIREIIYNETGKPVDYKFLSINKAYEEMTGLKASKIIGKTAHEIFPNIEEVWIDKFAEVVRDRRTITIEDFSRDLGAYHKVIAYPHKDNQFIVVGEDITDRKQYEDNLLITTNRYHELAKQSKTVTWETDQNGLYTYISSVVQDVLGFMPDEIINQKHYHEMLSSDFKESSGIMHDLVNAISIPSSIEKKCLSITGKDVWLLSTSMPIYNKKNELIGYRGNDRDITHEKETELQLTYLKYHDKLTGLYNRDYYHLRLEELDNKQRYPIATALLDIDGLKVINDAYGYDAGNQVIVMIAEKLKTICNHDRMLFRVGGDEFAILGYDVSMSEFNNKNMRLETINNNLRFNGIELFISYGRAIKTSAEGNVETLIQEAEKEMFKMKSVQGQGVRSRAIMSILKTLTNKYTEEEKHSSRVSDYCEQMGIALNYPNSKIVEIKLAGMIHDVGKISIPDSIIRKPDKLTEKEWQIMKSHTVVGYEILSTADQFSDLAQSARSHHERVDGKGYPDGLIGNQIPESARIICIVDAYEAMTSDRVYRKALTEELAINELRRYSGTQFDSELVKLFVEKVLKK